MLSDPPTETASRGRAHQLLDDWLARWPGARVNGWAAASARLGFVDVMAPLLCATYLNVSEEDIAGTLRANPAALLGTGEGATAPDALAAAWQMILSYWQPPAWPRPLPRIHDTLLVILSRPDGLTMDELGATVEELQARIGDHSNVFFFHGEAPGLPVQVRITVMCLFSPMASQPQ